MTRLSPCSPATSGWPCCRFRLNTTAANSRPSSWKQPAFRAGRADRLIPTRANNQPAFGLYLQDPHTRIARASGLLVLTLVGPQIGAMTRFDNSVLAHFGLPRILPG